MAITPVVFIGLALVPFAVTVGYPFIQVRNALRERDYGLAALILVLGCTIQIACVVVFAAWAVGWVIRISN